MPFHAINSYEEDLLDQAQQHTLELQLEKGLAIYNDALKAQSIKDVELARRLYKELFALDVFKFERYRHIPPSSYRLKSLALKNFALLLLLELESQHHELSKDDLIEGLREVVANVLAALELNNDDNGTQELLYSLALTFGLKRIARATLENIVSAEDGRALSIGESALSSNSFRLLSPRDRRYLSSLLNLLSEIQDDLSPSIPTFVPGKATSQQLTELSWLQEKTEFCNSISELCEHLSSSSTQRQLPILTKDWTVVAAALETALIGITKRKPRNSMDPYSYSVHPLFSVEFIAPHGDRMVPEAEKQTALSQSNGPESEAETDVEVVINSQTPVTAAAADSENAGDSTEPGNTEPVPVEQSEPKRKAAAEVVRSSKRVKVLETDSALASDFGISDDTFAGHVSSYLSLCGLSYPSVVPVFTSPDDLSPEYSYLIDFKTVLQSWDDEQAMVFLAKDVSDLDSSFNVMQLLDSAAIGDGSEVMRAPFVTDPGDVDQFLKGFDEGRKHVQQARLDLLFSLCSSTNAHGPLIIKYAFPANLIASVSSLADSLQPIIVGRLRVEPGLEIIEVAQAAFEIFADELSSDKRKTRNQVVASKAKEHANFVLSSVRRWRGFVGDALNLVKFSDGRQDSFRDLVLRYQWVSIFVDQLEASTSAADNIGVLEQMKRWFEANAPAISISFPNYSNIPNASLSQVKTQISKFRAAEIFAKVLANDTSSGSESAELLEAMLMPDSRSVTIPEADAIAEFLKSASLDFKLSLWYKLLEAYSKLGEKRKSRDGLLEILRSTVDEMYGDTGADEATHSAAGSRTLQGLSVLYNVGRRLSELYLSDQSLILEISEKSAKDTLLLIVKILRTLHVYMLLDQAINFNLVQAPQHQTWEQASTKFRELLVYWWSLYYLYFRSAIPQGSRTPEILNDILSIIHEQLGNQGFCSVANSTLLKLNLDEMLRLDWPESEADILQCLNCRYGISLTTENFSPYNHHAVSTEMSKDDTMKLSKFIMNMILSKKNLTQTILKTDVRQVIEMFYEAIGRPDVSIAEIARNTDVLAGFMDAPLTPELIKRAYYGTLSLDFATSDDQTVKAIGKGGIYFVMGLLHYCQYGLKRRASPEKVEDLFLAIEYYKYDLVYNTNRFESWLGISQCYNYLAEVNLIWSPNMRMQVTDEMSAISYQKLGIVSGLMSVSVLARRSADPPLSKHFFEGLQNRVWGYMGKLLFYSAASPCNMKSYREDTVKRFVFINSMTSERLSKPVSEKTILRLSARYLQIAHSKAPMDWLWCYLLSKVLFKLDHPASEVLDLMVRATELRSHPSDRDSKATDVTLEPQQSVITLAQYYCRNSHISVDTAVSYLEKSTFHTPAPMTEAQQIMPSNVYVTELAIAALKKLQQADRKHWLHRPAYWQAKFWLAMNSTTNAKEELGQLFTLKTNAKNPLQIWKPEYERPGQHFVYAKEYTSMYSDLLYKTRDDALLGVLVKKLRRFTAISDHQKLWEQVAGQAVKLLRELLEIPVKFSEKVIPQLDPDVFFSRSEELAQWFSAQVSQDKFDPWVYALDYGMELRRLNNGYGSTAAMDDIVICIYLAIYEVFKPQTDPLVLGTSVTTEIPIAAESPSPLSRDSPRLGTQDHVDNPVSPSASKVSSVFARLPTSSIGSSVHVAPAEGAAADQDSKNRKRTKLIRKDILQAAHSAIKPLNSKLNASSEPREVPRVLYRAGLNLELAHPEKNSKLNNANTGSTPPRSNSGSEMESKEAASRALTFGAVQGLPAIANKEGTEDVPLLPPINSQGLVSPRQHLQWQELEQSTVPSGSPPSGSNTPGHQTLPFLEPVTLFASELQSRALSNNPKQD